MLSCQVLPIGALLVGAHEMVSLSSASSPLLVAATNKLAAHELPAREALCNCECVVTTSNELAAREASITCVVVRFVPLSGQTRRVLD